MEDENTIIDIKNALNLEQVNVIVSDLSPEYTGEFDIDHIKMVHLNFLALRIAENSLKNGGILLMKSLLGTNESFFYVINIFLKQTVIMFVNSIKIIILF